MNFKKKIYIFVISVIVTNIITFGIGFVVYSSQYYVTVYNRFTRETIDKPGMKLTCLVTGTYREWADKKLTLQEAPFEILITCDNISKNKAYVNARKVNIIYKNQTYPCDLSVSSISVEPNRHAFIEGKTYIDLKQFDHFIMQFIYEIDGKENEINFSIDRTTSYSFDLRFISIFLSA